MAINVNVQYNGGFLPDIILWTQCYLHRGTCLNDMKRFCICSLLIPPKRFDIFYNGNAQQNPLCAASCVTKDIHISPRFSPAFLLSRCKFSTPTSTSLYSGINGLYAQDPVFEIMMRA